MFEKANKYLLAIGLNQDNSQQLWLHTVAIGFSPKYLAENADGIRRKWPRIPLPASKQILKSSVELGREVIELLNSESSMDGITSGALRSEMTVIGNLCTPGSAALDPAEDLKLTNGWGRRAGKVVNPGKGKVHKRDYTSAEQDAITKGAAALGLTMEQALDSLGHKTFDAYH